MTTGLKHLAYEIELHPGESLALPPAMLNAVGPGRWIVSIEPAENTTAIRDHSAFLTGYSAEDEGLYDERAIPIIQEGQQ